MCRVVPLSKGYVAIVDEADWSLVSQYEWYAVGRPNEKVYAYARGPKPIAMHRLIIGAKKGQLVDHRDGHGLNNRRGNLRIATHEGNARNRRGWHKSDLPKGVRVASGERFRAEIRVSGKTLRLGYFATAEEAARAYDRAAIQHFGEFAWLNYPESLVAA